MFVLKDHTASLELDHMNWSALIVPTQAGVSPAGDVAILVTAEADDEIAVAVDVVAVHFIRSRSVIVGV